MLRRFSEAREDYTWRHAFEESPVTLIDRVEAAAGRIRGYGFRRSENEREIVLFRDSGPFAGHADVPLADLVSDLLHVKAERIEGKTWLEISGRSEARVIHRVRRALAKAR